MQLQSSVHFDIFSNLFYLKNISDHTGYMSLLTPLSRRSSISVQSSDGIIKQTPELAESVRDFCLHIATCAKNSFYLDKLTYLVTLCRKVKIFDADDKVYFQNHNFNGGNFEFILATNDKLIYPHDIERVLKVPYFYSTKRLPADTPVYIEKYDKHRAFVRPLTMEDRVVDKNLNQIWPMATGQIPLGLKKLLEQTTEKVR